MTLTSRPAQLLTAARAGLRERRQARRDYRALARELACYSTPNDVDDLLAAIDDQTGADAEQIRDILTRNLAASRTHTLAS
ncbi:MAG: hypothetical protein JWR90_3780 [Marmoricola sp.]|jgi:hypothetical protein|nr:hypothetical protein [Marmoricola sp.]